MGPLLNLALVVGARSEGGKGQGETGRGRGKREGERERVAGGEKGKGRGKGKGKGKGKREGGGERGRGGKGNWEGYKSPCLCIPPTNFLTNPITSTIKTWRAWSKLDYFLYRKSSSRDAFFK